MPVDASIQFRGGEPKLEHRVFGKTDDRCEAFVTLDIGDGQGGRLTIFANSPEVLWQIASAAGAAAGAFARQLRAEEAAERALSDTDPEPPVVIYSPDLGGES